MDAINTGQRTRNPLDFGLRNIGKWQTFDAFYIQKKCMNQFASVFALENGD